MSGIRITTLSDEEVFLGENAVEKLRGLIHDDYEALQPFSVVKGGASHV